MINLKDMQKVYNFMQRMRRKENGMDLQKAKHQYAQVMLQIGVALKAGQPVFIDAPVDAAGFVEILVAEAYAAGAPDVYVFWNCESVDCISAGHRAPTPVEEETALARRYADAGAGYIRLLCPTFSVPASVSPDRINQMTMISTERRKLFRTSSRHGGFTLCCVPCAEWADRVYPDLPAEQRLAALWETVLTSARCTGGTEDPVAAWKDYIAMTRARKERLDRNGYQTYRFRCAGTDLTICPAQGAKWAGGCNEYPGERVFIPNLPTEEVFCVPNRYRVEGYVQSTKPLNYNGSLIEHFTLRFSEGRVVAYQAEKGQELLESILETDEGARYLGEFALVDQQSPIARINRVFYTTLFDENAACHLALGMMAGQLPLDKAEEWGLNQSRVHVDFMFGADDLLVEGQRPDGSWDTIMENGRWAGAFCV